jgi:hypothetical protein
MSSVQVVHFLPGRVRLKVHAAKGNAAYIARVREAFLEVPGIRSLEANPITGSVLIIYDTGRITQTDAARALAKALGTHFPSLDIPSVLRWLNVPHQAVTNP